MTTNNLRIGVDFDGVLFDHVPYILRGFRDRYGIDLNDEGLRHWDFYHYEAVRAADLPPSKVYGLLQDIETDSLLHVEPPRDARAAPVMASWLEAGHEVHIVTARGHHAEAATRLFLQTHGIPHSGLHMGVRIKTGWDVLVDDAPHNVLTAAADGTLALLMDHPYNRDVPAHSNPKRVQDWSQVAMEVASAYRGGPAAIRANPLQVRRAAMAATP